MEFFRALDAEATALWRAAGFPVVDLSSVVFDARGNRARTLTSDSVHFEPSALKYINGYILDAVCDLRRARGWRIE